MKYNEGASHLRREDWDNACMHLDKARVALKSLANKLNYEYTESQIWPEIKLKKKQGRDVREYRLALQSEYLQNEKPFYEFRYFQFAKPIFGCPLLESQYVLGTFAAEELLCSEKTIDDITTLMLNTNT